MAIDGWRLVLLVSCLGARARGASSIGLSLPVGLYLLYALGRPDGGVTPEGRGGEEGGGGGLTGLNRTWVSADLSARRTYPDRPAESPV